MRGLADLLPEMPVSRRPGVGVGFSIQKFIYHNADSVWERDRGDGDRLGSAWAGPYKASAVSAMCSGLDTLVAAAVSVPQRHFGSV